MSNTNEPKQPERITCINCGVVATFEALVKERPVEDWPSLTEIGLECPQCQHWIHACFINPELRRRRLKMETALKNYRGNPTRGNMDRYQKAKGYYKRRFNIVNKKLREELGVQSPTELLAEEEE